MDTLRILVMSALIFSAFTALTEADNEFSLSGSSDDKSDYVHDRDDYKRDRENTDWDNRDKDNRDKDDCDRDKNSKEDSDDDNVSDETN